MGQHLYVDQRHPHWQLALARWIDELQAIKQRKGAEQLILRDLPADNDALIDCLRQLGFSAHRLPDMLVLPSLDWTSREEYLQRLGQKYRYNVKKEAIAREEQFELEVEQNADSATVRRCYELYSAVHARSYKINVFKLPLALFEQAFRHPEYDLLRLYLRGSRNTADLVACLLSHVHGGHYSALLVGLDQAHLTSHGIYKQILFRCVERAHALNATQLNLAFTADLEKKKLGARPIPTLALVQQDDDYASTVMAAI